MSHCGQACHHHHHAALREKQDICSRDESYVAPFHLIGVCTDSLLCTWHVYTDLGWVHSLGGATVESRLLEHVDGSKLTPSSKSVKLFLMTIV
jgi:hypothetical protein